MVVGRYVHESTKTKALIKARKMTIGSNYVVKEVKPTRKKELYYAVMRKRKKSVKVSASNRARAYKRRNPRRR